MAWASAVWENQPSVRSSYTSFSLEMKRVFDNPVKGKETSNRLLSLSQGNLSAAEYTVRFRTLAAELRWNDDALQAVFVKGLNDALKDELATSDEAVSLNALMETVIRLDNRLRERRRERVSRSVFNSQRTSSVSSGAALAPSYPHTNRPNPPEPVSEEPMQLGRTQLTPEERQRRRQSGACLYCGEKGHYLSNCSVRPKGDARQ